MDRALVVILSLSLSGSILALIQFAIRAAVKTRLTHTWQYYMWLVVILRLLLPITPQFGFVQELAHRPLEQIRSAQDGAVAASPLPAGALAAPEDGDGPALWAAPQPQANSNGSMPVTALDWRPPQYAWIIWLGVAAALFCRKITVYLRFKRYVYAGAKEITRGTVHGLYQDELAMCGVRCSLPIFCNNRVHSPMLLGIFRPAVIVPVLELSDDGFRHVVRHELTHYKRQDYLYKWLVQLTLCLHWFNPLVHLIAKQINLSCELACDEAVIRTLEEERAAYGDALMASLRSRGSTGNSVVALTMSEGATAIKNRLEAIMSYKQKPRIWRTTAAALALLSCYSFFVVGAAAKPGPPAPVSTLQQTNTTPTPVEPAQTAVQQADPFAAYPPREHNWSHIDSIYRDDYYIVAGWRNNDTLQRYAWSTTMEVDGKQHRVAMWDEVNSFANDRQAMQLVNDLVAAIVRQSDPGRSWEGSFWVVRDVFHQVPPDDIMTIAYQQKNLIGFEGILPFCSDTALAAQLEAAYNDGEESYVRALCNHLPGSYNGEALATRAAQDGERTMFDAIRNFVPFERGQELREILDAAERNHPGR